MRHLHGRPIKRRLWALVALEFLFGVVYGTFSLTLPILAENIFINLAVLGVIFSLPEILGTVIDVPIGEFAKRFGRRKTIFYSGAMLAVSSLAFVALRSPFFFVATLIFYEVATQSFIIPGDAEETALTPAGSTGRFNSFLEGFHNLGFSIGPIAAGIVIGTQIEYAFLITFVVSISMMVLSYVSLPMEENHKGFRQSLLDLITRDKFFKTGFSEFARLGFEGVFVAFFLCLRFTGDLLPLPSRCTQRVWGLMNFKSVLSMPASPCRYSS